MPTAGFSTELAAHGPHGPGRERPATLDEARAYCRRLARTHYENFTVASWLLPRALRQHFANLYAWCRWADDLADETAGPEEASRLLDWWEEQLADCYDGRASQPVFVALQDTIREFDLPRAPFNDLLTAFRQDQRVTRYETFDDLLGYCRNSANPVGRLVLRLGRCHDETRAFLSDDICTGLQLANFCQDVARDWDRGRIYLPQASCRQFGCDEAMFARREVNDSFRQLLAHEVDRAELFLHAGTALPERVPRELARPIALFRQGGLAIVQAIRRANYDVWTRRPTVSRLQKAGLLARSLWPRAQPPACEACR